MARGLTVALPKGRMLEPTMSLLGRAGMDLSAVRGDLSGRRLVFDLPGGTRVLLVKPIDIPTYVEHGIADLGIAGRDTLEEQTRDLYQPLDLGIGACRLAVAAPRDHPSPLVAGMQVRVATKYPKITLRHYRSRGIQPEIIALYGSVELGAVSGLCQHIVDLVESGETLRQNRLVEVEPILEVTSWLVVHPASLKLKLDAVNSTIRAIRRAVKGGRAPRRGPG
jgi:ATP phosphoribosyltransferase